MAYSAGLQTKIVAQLHIDDCTTAVNATVSGTQFPVKDGSGAIIGYLTNGVRVANAFGTKGGIRLIGSQVTSSIPQVAGVKGFAMVVKDYGDGGTARNFAGGALLSQQSITINTVVPTKIEFEKWGYTDPATVNTGALDSNPFAYKNGKRAAPGMWSRHTWGDCIYEHFVTGMSYTVDRIGEWSSNRPAVNIVFAHLLLLNAQLTTAEVAEVQDLQRSEFSTPDYLPPLAVFRGASHTVGYRGVSQGYHGGIPGYVTHLARGEYWDSANLGIVGNTTALILSGNGSSINSFDNWEGLLIPSTAAGRKRIEYWLWVGQNDYGGGVSTATAYANIVTICNKIRTLAAANNVTININLSTLSDRSDANLASYGNPAINRSTWDTWRNAYNALITANTSGSSTGPGNQVATRIHDVYAIQVSGSPAFQDATNVTTYYAPDGLHLNDAGYNLVGDTYLASGVFDAATVTIRAPAVVTGNVGDASGLFEVYPDGGFTGTWTPSDGGAGTFSPSSLTWAGTGEAKTFTYTPATSGVKSITGSATGLSAPTAVSYTANAVATGDTDPSRYRLSIGIQIGF